jgi:hypothetical protein
VLLFRILRGLIKLIPAKIRSHTNIPIALNNHCWIYHQAHFRPDCIKIRLSTCPTRTSSHGPISMQQKMPSVSRLAITLKESSFLDRFQSRRMEERANWTASYCEPIGGGEGCRHVVQDSRRPGKVGGVCDCFARRFSRRYTCHLCILA